MSKSHILASKFIMFFEVALTTLSNTRVHERKHARSATYLDHMSACPMHAPKNCYAKDLKVKVGKKNIIDLAS